MGAGRGQRVYRTEAIVLRRLSTGETDRIVTLFSRDLGRLSAIAKGARGPRSRLAGATEPFTHFSGLLAMGQNLDVLTQAEVRSAFSGLRKDLLRVSCAAYFVELVDAAVTERQPQPALWDLLHAALSQAERGPAPELVCRAFELQAMSLAGYEPHLESCVQDGEPVDRAGSGFHPLRGGMLCPGCARAHPGSVRLSPPARLALLRLRGVSMEQAALAELAAPVRREIARCMAPYVRHHLESRLRSLHFLDQLDQLEHLERPGQGRAPRGGPGGGEQ